MVGSATAGACRSPDPRGDCAPSLGVGDHDSRPPPPDPASPSWTSSWWRPPPRWPGSGKTQKGSGMRAPAVPPYPPRNKAYWEVVRICRIEDVLGCSVAAENTLPQELLSTHIKPIKRLLRLIVSIGQLGRGLLDWRLVVLLNSNNNSIKLLLEFFQGKIRRLHRLCGHFLHGSWQLNHKKRGKNFFTKQINKPEFLLKKEGGENN